MERNGRKTHIRHEHFDSNLKHGLCTSFTEQEFCDVTFAVGNHLYNAHKVVLSLSSLYLKNILLASPSKYPIVVLSDIRPKILEYLLQYIYCGSVEVPECDMEDFISAGQNLHIKGLQNSFLSNSTDNSATVNAVLSKEEAITKPHASSKLSFKPDTLKTCKTRKSSEIESDKPPKKAKKRHSVSFKLEPNLIKENDVDQVPYENIMEPEVRIQDEFFQIEKAEENHIEGFSDIHAGYVHNADIKFVTGTSGKLHLVCNHYTFHKNTMRRDRVYWLCAAYQSPLQCRARCVSIDGKVVSITGSHNHDSDYKVRPSPIMGNADSSTENKSALDPEKSQVQQDI